MSQSSNRWRRSVIILGDIAVLYASLWLMLLTRYQTLPSPERWNQHVKPFTFVFLIYLVSFSIVGLYQLAIARNSKTFHRALGLAMFAATAIAAIFFYVVRPGITPRLNLLIFVALTALLVTLWRRLLNSILGSTLLVRTLILGYSRDSLELGKTLRANPQLGYTLIAFALNPSEASHHAVLEDEHISVRVCAPEELRTLIRNEHIELVIPATDGHIPAEVVNTLYAGANDRVSIADLPSVFETATGKVPVQSISELWFLEHATALVKPLLEAAKRAIDIFLSLLALVLALPFSPFIYTAIKLDSPGSGFFMQRRIGKGGKLFLAIKFRSMYWGRGEHGPVQVAEGDPRVTRVGKFLRKTRLDELPQLLNILKGDMSFVGPRPEQPALVESLSARIPFYRERLTVKPGLTGWDQISGVYHSASVEDTLEKLQYDLYYIKNRSLFLDATILLRTIKTVFSAQGR
jgi:exopolysaccharide biosynthesis polyprenyl glycosylphosphotransferase